MRREVTGIRAQLDARYDILVVGYCRSTDALRGIDVVPMRFFQDRPDYNRYWIVEYDVRFGGDWSSLFEELASSDADVLCTTVQAYADNPDWAHWHTLVTGGEEIPLDRRVKGFIPFGRVSRRLLDACDARYREGWSGHPEVLWPTTGCRFPGWL